MYSVELFNQLYYSDNLELLIKKVHEVVEEQMKPSKVVNIHGKEITDINNKGCYHIKYKIETGSKIFCNHELHININNHLDKIEEV